MCCLKLMHKMCDVYSVHSYIYIYTQYAILIMLFDNVIINVNIYFSN